MIAINRLTALQITHTIFFRMMYQDMQSEVPSQEALLESLETRAESLYSSVSEERTVELRDRDCNLEERWCSLSTNIPLRY